MDLVMVTAPNPPGSSTLISPPAAVFEIAPANVLHGAVRLHGFASSPTPETQVRVACANADVPANINATNAIEQRNLIRLLKTDERAMGTGKSCAADSTGGALESSAN